MTNSEVETARTFLEFSRRKLTVEFWPRICNCLDSLTEEQVWWRPNEASNSIGNLLLHLNGNVRQWIVSGLGGAEDSRNRRAEFSERDHIPLSSLRSKLDETLKEVDRVLQGLQGSDLLRKRSIQGYENVAALEAVYHVVEHFAMHYGQILYITKMLNSEDLGFFRHLN
jgi:uncharacterized damage-inducible protein DinB